MVALIAQLGIRLIQQGGLLYCSNFTCDFHCNPALRCVITGSSKIKGQIMNEANNCI